MKKLLATLLALFVVCLPLYTHADTADHWVLFSGNNEIAVEADDSGLSNYPDSTLTIRLKNSDPATPVDTSRPLPMGAATDDIVSDPQWGTLIDSATRQTLTEAGSLKGRFVMAALDFGKIKETVSLNMFSFNFLVTQENATYAALGLSAPNSGVISQVEFSNLPDILAIPIQEGTISKLMIFAGDTLGEGAASADATLTIVIDATALTYAPLPTHVSGFDRVTFSPNGAARIAPTLSYTARTASGPRDMGVPGNIGWSFSDSVNTVSDSAPNGGGLANLAAYLGVTYSPNAATDLQWTASPADTRFSSASGTLRAEIVEGAPQSTNAMGASASAPSINTSHSTYNGYGDFLIQTGSMRSQLSGLSINGVTLLEGVDYTVEETAGNIAIIRVYESVMQAITEGDAQITVRFVNGSVNTTVMIAGFYVPEILTDPPKTGDARSFHGLYMVIFAVALTFAAAALRRQTNAS